MVALGIFPITAMASPYDDHIANGSSLVHDGHYSLAAAEFEAAYLLKKDPGIALQLGRIYLKLQRAAGAQRYCSAYLRLTGSAEPDPDREAKARDCVSQATQLMRASTSPLKPMTAVVKPEARRLHQNAQRNVATTGAQLNPTVASTEPVSLDLSTQAERRIPGPPAHERSLSAEKEVPVEDVLAQQLTDPVVTLKFRSAMISPLWASVI